jgi:acetyltransferase-like isoleucine patch superfamily enzyme
LKTNRDTGGKPIMKTSFYEPEELKSLGLKSYGENVKISRKTSIYNPEEISLGNNIRIDDYCILSGKIKIGSYVHVAAYTALYAQYEPLTIGDFVGLSSRIAIYTFSDDLIWGISLGNSTIPDEFRAKVDKGPVVLEKHVMISSGSVILPKTEIKMGAVVGALSLVRGKVDAWKIYRGNPLKFVSKRPSKRILELEEKLKKKYPF